MFALVAPKDTKLSKRMMISLDKFVYKKKVPTVKMFVAFSAVCPCALFDRNKESDTSMTT